MFFTSGTLELRTTSLNSEDSKYENGTGCFNLKLFKWENGIDLK